MAVRSGATQVQGTMNGIGERCGNANLISLIANLALLHLRAGQPTEAAAVLRHYLGAHPGDAELQAQFVRALRPGCARLGRGEGEIAVEILERTERDGQPAFRALRFNAAIALHRMAAGRQQLVEPIKNSLPMIALGTLFAIVFGTLVSTRTNEQGPPPGLDVKG